MPDKDNSQYNGHSEAIQVHLTILQNVISRMASNSSSSKTWCITIVSAILVIVADKSKPNLAWIAIIPTFLFCVLDIYYLGLEKGFRASYNSFIEKLQDGILNQNDFFKVAPEGNKLQLYIQSMRSFSIWPFYTVLFVMIYFLKKCVL